MKKKFTIEFLYDSGVTEQFETEEGTQEDVGEISKTIKDAIRSGILGTISLKDKNGNIASVNISKITRFTII